VLNAHIHKAILYALLLESIVGKVEYCLGALPAAAAQFHGMQYS
jgi:hypothetical protein